MFFYSRGGELESAIEDPVSKRGEEIVEDPVPRKNSFERKGVVKRGGGDTSQLRGDWQSDIPDIHWKLGPLCSLLMEILKKQFCRSPLLPNLETGVVEASPSK